MGMHYHTNIGPIMYMRPQPNANYPINMQCWSNDICYLGRLNNRKVRNDLLYAKKTPLNTPDSQFRGVFVQEDLTQPRSKLLRFVKNHENTDRARTSEGRIRATLKTDRGAGKSVVLENPDDLFKLGIDSVDITQFGYPDM